MSAVNGRKPTGKLEPGQYGLDIHEVIDGSHKPDARKWTNQNVLYVDAQLDDVIAGFGSYRLLRLLLHLRRRIGNGKSKLNPGIDSIARVCRINKGIVIAELRMVKKLGYIEVQLGRRGGHQYFTLRLQ